jgi:glycosyltransferase involved in cell wall biosynthesis
MDLDVILPFHRVDSYLKEAIESLVLCQSVSINVIAVDDRPGQKSDISDILKPLRKYQILSTAGGQGYGEALRLGTSALENPVTALFNSDDLLNPLKFRRQLDQLENSELSLTGMRRIRADGRFSSSLTGSISSNTYEPIFLLFGAYGANATWCMRKDWWVNNAFFDDQECLDWRIALSSFRDTKISFINEPLYLYRKHMSQTTANNKIDQSKMLPVFEKWVALANSFNLFSNSRQIFDLFATPWLVGRRVTYKEAEEWFHSVKKQISRFDVALAQDLEKIVARRYLFASQNKNNPMLSRAKYAIKGSPQIVPLFQELAFSQ